MRLAARGRCVSVEEFVRVAVLRAACDLQGAFAAPGESEQAVAAIQWRAEQTFRREPRRDSVLCFRASGQEQQALMGLKVVLGEIVHGRRASNVVGVRLADWLREQAWQTPSNRVARKTGLSVVPLPPGSARVEDGALVISMGSLAVTVQLGERNRRAYPGPGVFEDGQLVQTSGGRWDLRHSAYRTAVAPIKKARPAR